VGVALFDSVVGSGVGVGVGVAWGCWVVSPRIADLACEARFKAKSEMRMAMTESAMATQEIVVFVSIRIYFIFSVSL
jgi:hypothetical protein